MQIKGIIDEDFINYKKPSMFIAFSTCTFKCERECGEKVCQNGTLATSPNIEVDVKRIVDRYIENPITSAICCGGLEPFDSWVALYNLITEFRKVTDDDIIIYTGYYKEELKDKLKMLKGYKNIIVKFGRFMPNQKPHYDEILGVYLASDNQQAEKIS